jgi:hypothetical protein
MDDEWGKCVFLCAILLPDIGVVKFIVEIVILQMLIISIRMTLKRRLPWEPISGKARMRMKT